MTNFTPGITSPHNSTPSVALRLGRPLPGFLPVELALLAPFVPDWARRAIVGAE